SLLSASAVAELVRPELRRLPLYHLDLEPCRFKLDQNEVPWELPRAVKAEILRRLEAARFAAYPDFHADALRRALGRFHGHPAEGVLVGNGSNELLRLVLEALAGPGREVLGALPGFGLYRMMIEASGGRARFLGPNPELAIPVAELEAELERDPARPLLLCSPNNPTGEALPPEVLERLLARLEAPLLLDNAYGEFCRHDYRPLLARHPQLVLFRTFSKAWSLAGLRLGYLLAAPELVAELLKVKLPYNLGHAGAIAGEVVLEAAGTFARRVEVLVRRREDWRRMLLARGFEVYPSEANFLLARCPGGQAERVLLGLAEAGIRVRDFSRGPGLAGCLRFSVGTGAALRATAAALDRLQGGMP
nr:histidinol-phosphate transaminase [Thermoanaerobaculia bacterium]